MGKRRPTCNDIYKRVELLLDNFAKDMAREYYKDYYYESN